MRLHRQYEEAALALESGIAAVESIVRERDEWKRRCAEETIAWAEATKRADRAEAYWRAAEDECRAAQSRLDGALADVEIRSAER